MSDDLVKEEEFSIAPAGTDQKAMAKLAERNFLPYVTLSTATSDIGKKGKVKMGNYALMTGKDTFEDLGDNFESLVLAYRPKACRKTVTGLTSVFNMDDEEYKKIKAEADSKKLGSWYGLEFLEWLHLSRRFVTYHAGNATARGNSSELVTILTEWDAELKAAAAAKKEGREVPKVRNPQAFSRSFMARGQGQDYWAPKFGRATTPFSVVPSMEEIREEVRRFITPKRGPLTEAVEAGSVDDRG